jgi:tRNA (guanine-N7-)-methyltransferase
MGRKRKLKKFAELSTFKNVFENFDPGQPVLRVAGTGVPDMRGKWREKYFLNEDPITIELACGAGEYTLALAALFPNGNFIGVDIKGSRIWKGAKKALQHQIDRVAFLRTRIEFIDLFFDEDEVDEIWITFPDPFPKEKRATKRLTSPGFLDRYHRIVKTGGIIHLKTDNRLLYEYSLAVVADHPSAEIICAEPDLYATGPGEVLSIKTKYELRHLSDGKKITYIRFRMN